MRREHSIQQSYVDWLKSIGCKVYMPLTHNDLKDYISGVDATVTGYGSMTWNSTYNMYLFTTPTQTLQGVLSLPLIWGTSKCITAMCKLRAQLSGDMNCNAVNLMNNSSFAMMTLGDAKRSDNSPTSVMRLWAKTSTPFANCHQYSWDSGNIYRKFIQDGSVYYQDTYNINFGNQCTRIDIASSLSPSQTGSYARYNGANFLLSDLYIFDAALDIDTIKNIQGIV